MKENNERNNNEKNNTENSKEKQEEKSSIVTRESFGAVGAVFFFLAFFIMVTGKWVFGSLGEWVNSFLWGMFGYTAYPLAVMGFILSINTVIGKKLIRNRKAGVSLGVFFLSFVLILHTALTYSVPVKGYISACFRAGKTFSSSTLAGGVGATLVFPLIKFTAKAGTLVILSVIFLLSAYFSVLFLTGKNIFALRGGKKNPAKRKIKEKQEKQVGAEQHLKQQKNVVYGQNGQNGQAYGQNYGRNAVVGNALVSPANVSSPANPIAATPSASNSPSAYMPQGGNGYAGAPFGGYMPTAQGGMPPDKVGQKNVQPEKVLETGGNSEDKKEFLFGNTYDHYELFRKNLIFDPTSEINKKPPVDPSKAPQVQSITPAMPSYSEAYENSVNGRDDDAGRGANPNSRLEKVYTDNTFDSPYSSNYGYDAPVNSETPVSPIGRDDKGSFYDAYGGRNESIPPERVNVNPDISSLNTGLNAGLNAGAYGEPERRGADAFDRRSSFDRGEADSRGESFGNSGYEDFGGFGRDGSRRISEEPAEPLKGDASDFFDLFSPSNSDLNTGLNYDGGRNGENARINNTDAADSDFTRRGDAFGERREPQQSVNAENNFEPLNTSDVASENSDNQSRNRAFSEEEEGDRTADRLNVFDEEDDPYSLKENFSGDGQTPTEETRRNDDGFSYGEREENKEHEEEYNTPPSDIPVVPPKPVAAPKPKVHVHLPYRLVPMSYFDCDEPEPNLNEEEVEYNKQAIIGTLEDLKVNDATVSSVTYGPTVTRYNIIVPRYIRAQKVVACEQNIAMSLHSANGINIYPNFEDGAVSVEVPNKNRQAVPLGCMLMSEEYVNAKSTSLTFAFGKDIANRKVYGDICRMTHLLVAGASGSGKSVFLRVLIISLIVKYSPDELRLILIDPKKTEFAIYSGLPHLVINDIIDDPDRAVRCLDWAIAEMNRRNALFKEMTLAGKYVVDIDNYNKAVPPEEKLFKLVIVVDELADLMLAKKKEVEDRIQNLTQKARSAGIHLIISTQRPSTDVITGVIKGNLPTRIAFAVASDIDSRVILDASGAQKLLGKGDALYTMQGFPSPRRVQSALITPEDSQQVVNYIKENNECFFDDEIADFINDTHTMQADGGNDVSGEAVDPVYIDALRYAIQAGSASISMIQRKCGVGYNRAGKIIEWMESMGYVSLFDGAKARKVIITKEKFEQEYGEL